MNKINFIEEYKISQFTHPHKGIVSPTEEKYIVTGWFEII